MAITVCELAELIHGEIIGDGEKLIKAAKPLLEARSGDVTFIEDEKYISRYQASGASAAIVNLTLRVNGGTFVRVKNPREAFFTIHEILHPRTRPTHVGIHPTACVDPSATVAADAWIGPGVTIGEHCLIGAGCQLHAGVIVGNECQLSSNVVLFPNVVLYDGCVIGNRVIIHANSVLGADGFGYKMSQGHHVKVPQIGHVEIEDDVEIGACTTIDRATFGTTRIGAGTKIDNLVQVGHNCQIGRHNILCSQVGIAGSVTTGDYVVMAGQVGLSDHIHIGDRAQIGPQAGLAKNVPADQRMLGTPATPDREQMRIMILLEKLPEIRKDIKKIKQQLGLADATDKS